MGTPSSVPVDGCSLQHASVECTVGDFSPDTHLLNASSLHHTPGGLSDTAIAQHLHSGTSSSAVDYTMVSTIFGGLSLLLTLIWSPFAKIYWDKLRSPMKSSDPASSNSELELGSSGNQAA
ncbi:hypothetical protein MKX08_000093 [Trichoderma sp. CBMAI-0020]|nr:hypothetical protein MKX08_000093 [Trichoderma sp. CBMAI-0020]